MIILCIADSPFPLSTSEEFILEKSSDLSLLPLKTVEASRIDETFSVIEAKTSAFVGIAAVATELRELTATFFELIAVVAAMLALGIAMGAFIRDPVTIRSMAGAPQELAHTGL